MLALALALSYFERFIPLQMLIPLPGVKLGLANIVTLIALYLFRIREAYLILILRCLFSSFFGGGLTGLAFSMTGGILAMLTMTLAKKTPLFSIYGVSILGAAAHNIGQIIAAAFLMHSYYIAAYLPYLLFTSLFTGTATAMVGAGVIKALQTIIISSASDMRKP